MLITLDRVSGAPLYQQIAGQLRAMIVSGRLSPGDPLPSIRQLAADLVISVITTKRAYQELDAQELIVTLPGRGTFVAALDLAARREAASGALSLQVAEIAERASLAGLSLDELQELLRDRWESTRQEDEADE